MCASLLDVAYLPVVTRAFLLIETTEVPVVLRARARAKSAAGRSFTSLLTRTSPLTPRMTCIRRSRCGCLALAPSRRC
jgi:hypothetical protein